MNNSPISFQIAERFGFQKDGNHFLRPPKNSDIAERFGHSREHNRQSYVKYANKPDTPAFVCGGSEYTLEQFAHTLGLSLDEFQPKPALTLQHESEIDLRSLSDAHFRYFLEHGLIDPVPLLKSLGVFLTTLKTGTHQGKRAFVFPLSNGSFKYFILNETFQVIDKRTSWKGNDTVWPSLQHDNGQDLILCEGFADCLKARQLGYNAFTWSGGVQSTGHLARLFKPSQRLVYLLLDHDSASQKALHTVALAFLQQEHLLKIVDLPFGNDVSRNEVSGKDLCDYFLHFPHSSFSTLLEQSRWYSPTSEESPFPALDRLDLPPCELEELQALVHSLAPHSALFFQAPTGLGKTHALIQQMVSAPQKRFTFFCSTVKEATDVYQKTVFLLQQAGRPKSDVLLLCSLENTPQLYALQQAPIVITNYGYLGRQGMTCNKHPYAPFLLRGRTVICDEVQELYQKMKVSHPLNTRYLQSEGEKGNIEFNEKKHCPLSAKQGDCSNCFPAYKRKNLTRRGFDRPFYHEVAGHAFAEHAQEPELSSALLKQWGFNSWDDLTSPEKYHSVIGTLFFKEFYSNWNDSQALAEQENDTQGYVAFLESLTKSLFTPHVRIEFPLLNGEPVLPQMAHHAKLDPQNEVQFPKQLCSVPHLCGIDPWPLWQITQEADAAIFTSATIPQEFHAIASQILLKKHWQSLERAVQNPPFQFDVTLLKTSENLGSTQLSNLLLKLDGELDKKTLIVAQKKSEAQDIYQLLKRSIPEKVEFFYRQDFEGEKYQHPLRSEEMQEQQFLLTYAKSALTRGANLGDVDLAFINCAQFIPQLALGSLTENMTEDEKMALLSADIRQNLTQICGRLFRSSLERSPGQTVQDPRKIVLLLHGLPQTLQQFKIDDALTFQQREYTQFVRTRKRATVDSIAEAISCCFQGENPVHYSLEQLKAEVAQDYKNGALRNIAPNERHLLSSEERDALTLEKKQEKLTLKIKAIQGEGASTREIKRAINYSRLKQTAPELALKIESILPTEPEKDTTQIDLESTVSAEPEPSSNHDFCPLIESKSQNDDTPEWSESRIRRMTRISRKRRIKRDKVGECKCFSVSSVQSSLSVILKIRQFIRSRDKTFEMCLYFKELSRKRRFFHFKSTLI